MAKKKIIEKQTLGRWLIEKYSTEKYRLGECESLIHHPKVDQKMIDKIGFEEILSQAEELEKEGLVQVEWKSIHTDIGRINFPMKNMPRLCRREGKRDERTYWLSCCEKLVEYSKNVKADWLLDYYGKLLNQLKKGKIPTQIEDDKLLECLNEISRLEKDIWRRRFSVQVFGDSKEFEKNYQNKVVNVLKDYSTFVEEKTEIEKKGIDWDEILAEFGILTYSQSLEIKGNLIYELGEEQIVDISSQIYGAVLNAQTLSHALPVYMEGVKQIITIENKANYEDMQYNPEILYIFVHGFPSPKERRFLADIMKIAPQNIKVSHWGDMDYGGIRIFQYLKKQVFPELIPLYMEREDFERAIEKGYGLPLEEEKRKKLEGMDAGVLEDLKACILEYGLEVEQECIERYI